MQQIEGPYTFFWILDPHLIKTTRNCWECKGRNLWVSQLSFTIFQKNGKNIYWQHLVHLYDKDRGKGTGLALVPKLKFEHLHLTSFSKMRVDLAAQVIISI